MLQFNTFICCLDISQNIPKQMCMNEGGGCRVAGGGIINTTFISLTFYHSECTQISFKCTLPICFLRALVLFHLRSQN